jgi:hypothetical protein
MDGRDVTVLLGTPERTSASGATEAWVYRYGRYYGYVYFKNGAVDGWSEP